MLGCVRAANGCKLATSLAPTRPEAAVWCTIGYHMNSFRTPIRTNPMSHRTKSLPEVSGIQHIVREIRYHEFSRQLLGIVLVVVFSVFARPLLSLFYAGVPLVVAGIAVRLWASGHIKKNKILATDGPYAFVRHPLYVGNILILVGFVLASGLWWTAAAAAVFFLAYYPTAIEYEDRKLESLFGEQWRQWRAGTRALLPRLKPYPSEEKGHWSFMYSMRGNGEPLIAVFLLFWLYFIFNKLS